MQKLAVDEPKVEEAKPVTELAPSMPTVSTPAPPVEKLKRSPEDQAKFDEEAASIDKAKTDQDAKDVLVHKYLGTLYSIAKDYMAWETGADGRTRSIGKIHDLPEIEDIVNASLEPFETAVQSYDPKVDVKFHTYLQNGVRQFLDNLYKAQAVQKRMPHAEVWDEGTKEFVDVPVKPLSIHETVKGKTGEEASEIIDSIKDEITSRPDWKTQYDMLVEEVDSLLNSDLKKQVFRKLVEFGFMTKKLTEIGQELGLKPSALSNIIGRDIKPAVEQVLGLS